MTPTNRPRPSALLALVAAAIVALSAAGCGSSVATPTSLAAATPRVTPVVTAEPTPTPTPTPTPEPTPTPTPEPTRSPVFLDDAMAATLQKTVTTLQTTKSFPALQVAIDFPDGRVWTGQSGKSVLSTKTPVTADTLFAIGSISKTFMAALILRLAERGTLTLDDTLAAYVPTFYLSSQITLRMLLNHTSGIYDVFAAAGMGPAILASPTKAWTTAQVLAKVGKQRYAFAPGKGYKYSNTDYVLLGAVVEKATGQTVASLVRAEFLEPLNLTSTYLQTQEKAADLGIENPLAHGYCPGPTGCSTLATQAAKPRDNFAGTMMPFTAETTVVGPAGGYASTAADVARWGSALYGGRILEPASLTAMTDVSQTAKFHPKWVYGFGMEQVTVGGLQAWGHRGNLDGFWSSVWYLPKYGVTIVIVANANWCDPLAISNSISKVILPAPPAPASAPPAATTSPAASAAP